MLVPNAVKPTFPKVVNKQPLDALRKKNNGAYLRPSFLCRMTTASWRLAHWLTQINSNKAVKALLESLSMPEPSPSIQEIAAILAVKILVIVNTSKSQERSTPLTSLRP